MVPRHQQQSIHTTPVGSSIITPRQKKTARGSLQPLQSTPCWLLSAPRGGGGRGGLSRSLAHSKDSQRIVTSSSTSCLAAARPLNEKSERSILLRRQKDRSCNRPFQHVMMQALGPTALLGGTAAFYSAVYRHSACTLSPLSAFYLLLLALQTSIQPRLSRKYIKSTTNQQAVALTEEVVKTVVAAGLFWTCQDASVIQHSLHDWSWSSSLAVAGIPSILYAAQGVLTYTSHQHLNAVTFNGLSQTKTVSAAFFCYVLLGTRQSRIQMLAIFILFVSALIFQGLLSFLVRPPPGNVVAIPTKQQQSSPASDDNTKTSTASPPPTTSEKSVNSSSSTNNSRDSTWFAKGIVPCLGATFLSGLAGAFSQRGLQLVGGTGRNAFLFTIEVSFYSALALIVSMLWNNHHHHLRNNKSNNNNRNTTESAKASPFSWSKVWAQRSDILKALIPITVKAMGGILTALVHKHAGSVLKGFALVLGLVLSGLLQTVLDEESLTVNQGIGTLLVMLSSWMHFTNPPKLAM